MSEQAPWPSETTAWGSLPGGSGPPPTGPPPGPAIHVELKVFGRYEASRPERLRVYLRGRSSWWAWTSMLPSSFGVAGRREPLLARPHRVSGPGVAEPAVAEPSVSVLPDNYDLDDEEPH